ncbi:MAG: type I phosphomannose isomerase catalytic subunit [Planctomycetota bacterium]|jgi:mannose-6-phosphate isomerase
MTKRPILERRPIKLAPEPVERIWGGQAVKKKFGWTPPEGKTIGEWWILSFRHDHPSFIADGEFKDIPLPQLVEAYPELLGMGVDPALLIKILDSADRLSVQVHPDDRLAREMGLDSGKTECWYYLESEPGAAIYCGLKEGVDLDTFFTRATQNPDPEAMETMMNIVPVKEHSLSFIPAGTLHAIGKGVLLMEVQQNSDTTFRIYDWGRPREVHLEQARQAMEKTLLDNCDEEEILEEGVLVSCEKFIMRKTGGSKSGRFPSSGAAYSSLTCLEGEGAIKCEDYESPFHPGDTWFVPAGCPDIVYENRNEGLWIFSQQPGE